MRGKSVGWGLAAALLALTSGQAVAQGRLSPVTDSMLQSPPPQDWLMFRRTLDSWGHSPLASIDRGNVQQLKLVWKRELEAGLQEGTPLVHDGTMFFPAPKEHMLALEAATGKLLWEYTRPLPEDVNRFIPVLGLNRSLAIHGSTVIDHANDQYVYALDAATGKLAWETRIGDYKKGSQHSTGPIAAAGKIFGTRGCEPEAGPVACVVTAHDAKSGKELWRTSLIAGPGDPNSDSWGDVPQEWRRQVGAWYSPSYDPETNRLIFGTSVSSPAPKYLLGGNDKSHLYHNSTLALDADTGKIVWHYQHLVDHWDLDHVFERLLVETAVAPDPASVPWINPRLKPGEVRKVVTGIPGKTGIVYTLDRATGEFLWARPTIHQNVVSAIDGATGAVTVNPDTVFHKKGDVRFVCPGASGGKNWQAGTYSPQTKLMYFPLQRTCSEVTAVLDKPDPAKGEAMATESLYGISLRGRPAPDSKEIGSIHAIDVSTGRTVWTRNQQAGTMSLLSTGGGLIFGGDAAGWFRAYDDRDGRILWEVDLNRAVTGFPVTFAVDGKQYVAVSTGQWLSASLNPEVKVGNVNELLVFALP